MWKALMLVAHWCLTERLMLFNLSVMLFHWHWTVSQPPHLEWSWASHKIIHHYILWSAAITGWESYCLLLMNMIWQGCVCLMYSEHVKAFNTNVWKLCFGVSKGEIPETIQALLLILVWINLCGNRWYGCVMGLGDITKKMFFIYLNICIYALKLLFFRNSHWSKVFVN